MIPFEITFLCKIFLFCVFLTSFYPWFYLYMLPSDLQIIEIQDRLIREGKLKTQSDIDKFREEAKDPVALNAYITKPASKQGKHVNKVNI